MLIETDILLAALNPSDPLRKYALRGLDQEHLNLSPYSLLELYLLVRAKKLEVRDHLGFAQNLSSFLNQYSVRTLHDRPEHHAKAFELESTFRLTYFDSLHAAVALNEGEKILSFDRSYDRLKEHELTRIDPRKLDEK